MPTETHSTIRISFRQHAVFSNAPQTIVGSVPKKPSAQILGFARAAWLDARYNVSLFAEQHALRSLGIPLK